MLPTMMQIRNKTDRGVRLIVQDCGSGKSSGGMLKIIAMEMKGVKMIRLVAGLIACLTLLGGMGAGSFDLKDKQAIGLQSFVLFNTLCANCHEGECSRRMCLSSEPKDAAGHIQRYAGAVSPLTITELYRQLAYMKQRCAYYPIEVAQSKGGAWKEATLAAHCLQSGRGCFIPLGPLVPGTYSINLSLKEAVPFRIEIISQHFDHLLDEQLHHTGLQLERSFVVDEAGLHFLRLVSKSRVFLKQLRISAP